MEKTAPPTIFLSYSRRELYFAESLALHLQKEGLDIWFDLQQLTVGTDWSDGLKDGIRDAGVLVLAVSKASMESPYVRDEWKSAAEKGNQLALAICEEVELPEELLDLPTYDFRRGFNEKIKDLTSFLKGETAARYDRVPAPNRLGILAKMPAVVWIILASQFGPLIAWLLGLMIKIAVHAFIPSVSLGSTLDKFVNGQFFYGL